MFNAGGSATIWLGEEFPLVKTQTVGVRPTQGTFGLDDARIIRPGSPGDSVLLYRMAKTGGGRMPRIGSSNVDPKAIELIALWIEGMPTPRPPHPSTKNRALWETIQANEVPDEVRTSLRALLSNTSEALRIASLLHQDKLTSLRTEAIALGLKSEKAEVRDLFESFLPPSRRVARLGEAFDPKVVLDRAGDARRGREVFLNNPAAQCKTCHRLDGEGKAVGPDLAGIGAKYPRVELLRHLIEPSLVIDPKFASYVVETKSGQVFTGLLVSRSDKELVLIDAAGKETRVPSDQVEQTISQPRSLMPELLLRDLTAQQAADLLEYLGSLRQATPR